MRLELRGLWRNTNLLPDTQLGGRKGVSVDHAIQLILGRSPSMEGRQNCKHGSPRCSWCIRYTIWYLTRGCCTICDKWDLVRLPPGYSHSLLAGARKSSYRMAISVKHFLHQLASHRARQISPILLLLFNAPLVRACTLRGLHYGESEAYG